MYEILLSVHLLAAVVWVGGSVALTVIASRMSAADRITAAPHFNWYGGKVLPAAAGVLLLAGFGLMGEIDASFGDPWISIAFAIWIVSAVLGVAVIGKAGKQIQAATAAGDRPAADAAFSRLLNVARIDALLVLVAVVVMAVKPGA